MIQRLIQDQWSVGLGFKVFLRFVFVIFSVLILVDFLKFYVSNVWVAIVTWETTPSSNFGLYWISRLQPHFRFQGSGHKMVSLTGRESEFHREFKA